MVLDKPGWVDHPPLMAGEVADVDLADVTCHSIPWSAAWGLHGIAPFSRAVLRTKVGTLMVLFLACHFLKFFYHKIPLTFALKDLWLKRKQDPGMNWDSDISELSKLFLLTCIECKFQFLKNPNKVININGRRLDLSLFGKWWPSRKIADWGETHRWFMLTQEPLQAAGRLSSK